MAVSVFIAYSHRDDQLRREIETHFAAMKRAGIISIWHDQLISPGTEWRNAISDHLDTAAYQFRSANLTMLPGDIGTFSTFYANVGTTTWLRNTETETGLLFLNREQRMRRWAHQWASEFVLARQTKDAVAPGDFTAYTFNCRVPDDVDVPSTEMFMCQPIVLAVVPLLIGQPEPFFVYVRAANDGRRRA